MVKCWQSYIATYTFLVSLSYVDMQVFGKKKLIPYSGKFSLVQIFAEKRPGSSEEIFAVFIFAKRGTLWPHPYRLMRHLRSFYYGILYSRRLILLYSNHLEGRQTVENHHVHIGTRRTHVMTSSISIFSRFLFSRKQVCPRKSRKFAPSENFPLYGITKAGETFSTRQDVQKIFLESCTL